MPEVRQAQGISALMAVWLTKDRLARFWATMDWLTRDRLADFVAIWGRPLRLPRLGWAGRDEERDLMGNTIRGCLSSYQRIDDPRKHIHVLYGG